ncbi:MAG: toxin-antitoxin system, antitoxin component, Xre family protein [Gammaproteobacteria bacterium]|nr:toxin-antitoxin system, antitoxin component, Xre family protein [Gammaproteobacteria bacterium]
MRARDEQSLLAKLKTLPPQRLAEVEDFVDFLCSRENDQQFVRAAANLAEASFAKIWDNPDDDVYDRL